jgi:DNA-binding MarR family transcriptional regulator
LSCCHYDNTIVITTEGRVAAATKSQRGTEADLAQLITVTRRAFHRLGRAADRLHDEEQLTAAERAIVVELAQHGMRTVPEMAKARPVSRQHIQTIVNGLLERRLVQQTPNPRHLRSGFITLTHGGHALVRRVLAKESDVLTRMARVFTSAELRSAARTLRRVTEVFDGPTFLKLLQPAESDLRRRSARALRTSRR